MLRHLLHDAGVHGDSAKTTTGAHNAIGNNREHEHRSKWSASHADCKQPHGDTDGTACAKLGHAPGGVKSTDKGTHTPSGIQPAVTDSTFVKDLVAQWGGDYDAGHHGAQA